MAFPKKNSIFGRFASLPPIPPKKRANVIFIVISPSIFRKLEKAAAVSGICSGVREKSCGKIPGKIFPNREMLQMLGFRALGKANLPGTLGRHCLDLDHTFRVGSFGNRQFQPSRVKKRASEDLGLCPYKLVWKRPFQTHRIGANPEKSDLVNFWGPK